MCRRLRSFQLTSRNVHNTLLAVDRIVSLASRVSALCHDIGVSRLRMGRVVTNGYLLTPPVAKRLASVGINEYQITLDGPKDIHDSRRMLVDGSGTFDTILSNLMALKDYCDRIYIRINVDRSNAEVIGGLLTQLQPLGEKVIVGLGLISPYTDVCMNIESTCLNPVEAAEERLRFQNILKDSGFRVEEPAKPRGHSCSAASSYTFVVDPRGDVYKCLSTVGQPKYKVGTVFGEMVLTRNLTKWLNWSPFDNPECLDCLLLPVCMGGCPYWEIVREKPRYECPHTKNQTLSLARVFFEETVRAR